MAINLSAIKDLLFPGLRELITTYKDYPNQWQPLYKKYDSIYALERTPEMRMLGLAQLKTEGGQTQMDNGSGERYIYNQEHVEVALGYAITRKAIEDNLYKTRFNPSNLGLMRSFNQTKEIMGANLFNTATTYSASIGGDGVALCATTHPIDGGTYANRPAVDADLNEATLLNAMIAVRSNFKDQAGLRANIAPRKLLVPPQLEPVAIRLTKAELRPGTSDNDPNAIAFTAGGLPEGYIVNQFLTSNFAWFVLTDEEGLNYMERAPFETDMHVDFATDNLLVKGRERYSFGYSNPRALYGSFPTT